MNGNPTLLGVGKSIAVNVKPAGDAWSGNALIRQTVYGIQGADGPARVQDRAHDKIEVQFDICALPK